MYVRTPLAARFDRRADPFLTSFSRAGQAGELSLLSFFVRHNRSLSHSKQVTS